MQFTIKRLGAGSQEIARQLFLLMANVFEEDCTPLSDRYLNRLLGREDFWALAAFEDETLVGGLTAHTLWMTTSESAEIFIYDLAILPAYQRCGIGRNLLAHLRQLAAADNIHTLFVPADNEDEHALDFYHALGGEASPVTFFNFTAL